MDKGRLTQCFNPIAVRTSVMQGPSHTLAHFDATGLIIYFSIAKSFLGL